MVVSFCTLLLRLSWQPVSLVIPASAFSYVVGTLGTKYILGEEISGSRWAEVLLVCAGVPLVAGG
jgi:drug/metabolite transporter (DMT)-like permease